MVPQSNLKITCCKYLYRMIIKIDENINLELINESHSQAIFEMVDNTKVGKIF